MSKTLISVKQFIEEVATDTGAPKKIVEEVLVGAQGTVKRLVLSHRPANIGDELVIRTPLVAYKERLMPEKVVVNPKTGEQFLRPSMYGINLGCPDEIVNSANTGIKLDKKPLGTPAKTGPANATPIKNAPAAKTA